LASKAVFPVTIQSECKEETLLVKSWNARTLTMAHYLVEFEYTYLRHVIGRVHSASFGVDSAHLSLVVASVG
jgi:hypothetical protein